MSPASGDTDLSPRKPQAMLLGSSSRCKCSGDLARHALARPSAPLPRLYKRSRAGTRACLLRTCEARCIPGCGLLRRALVSLGEVLHSSHAIKKPHFVSSNGLSILTARLRACFALQLHKSPRLTSRRGEPGRAVCAFGRRSWSTSTQHLRAEGDTATIDELHRYVSAR